MRIQRVFRIESLHKSLPIFLPLNNYLTSSSVDIDSTTQNPEKSIPTQLSNCTSLSELHQIHAHFLRNILLGLHTSSPFHWNNVIRSYTRLEAPTKALDAYVAMSHAGFLPDSYTLPIVLKAVCRAYALNFGRQLHSVAIQLGLKTNEYCESGFIGVYVKAGEFENAQKVFNENPDRKLGSWNAIIAGLSQGGRAKEAINMFIELKKRGFEPDDITMVSVTSACGSLGDLNLAHQLHKWVFQAKTTGENPDVLMSNSVIDMYGKCGRMDLAHKVFLETTKKNVSSWTSLIVGYAMHGHVREALESFSSMKEEGIMPNHVTFVGVLSACVHGGLVQEGRNYFNMMKNVYGIRPQLVHYGCMVDLMAKSGLLEEARELVEAMPMEANSVIYGCLMGGCEKHENVEMGEWVAHKLIELEPLNDGVYTVLSNIYASRGLWQEVENVRKFMKRRQLSKIPAYSFGAAPN